MLSKLWGTWNAENEVSGGERKTGGGVVVMDKAGHNIWLPGMELEGRRQQKDVS